MSKDIAFTMTSSDDDRVRHFDANGEEIFDEETLRDQNRKLRAALENLCDAFGEPQNFERGKWRDQIAYYEFWSEVEAARKVLASTQTDDPPTDAKGGE